MVGFDCTMSVNKFFISSGTVLTSLTSSGATRKSTPLTEAASYLSLANSLSLLSATSTGGVLERLASEEYALDSFQNFLFSLARFREVTGHYPSRITVVGYEMKGARFESLHRTALRWPVHAWSYIGIDIDDEEHQIEAQRGEVRPSLHCDNKMAK